MSIENQPLLSGEKLVHAIAQIASGIKAENIVALDLRGLSTVTDYFVICSGSSSPHLKAIRREIIEHLKDSHNRTASARDGTTESQWVVIDYGDVVVHVFHQEKRIVYSLEDLWSDAIATHFDEMGNPLTSGKHAAVMHH